MYSFEIYSYVDYLYTFTCMCAAEKKREVYDLYGKDAVRGASTTDDDFAHGSHGAFHFHFRSPEEIFREFFGTDDPFSRIFGGKNHHW